MSMEEYGNTSAASIPILLYEENRRGRLKKDSLLVLSGFGGGLTYGDFPAPLVKVQVNASFSGDSVWHSGGSDEMDVLDWRNQRRIRKC